jgi:hypothetical protein
VRSLTIRNRIDRSYGRARMVETPNDLADAGQDAYYLAVEVELLRGKIDRMIREHNEALARIKLPHWNHVQWK